MEPLEDKGFEKPDLDAPMSAMTIQISDAQPISETAQRAADLLQDGALVVLPTETVYGVAAAAFSDKGMAALRQFKGRLDTQPFTIHLPNPAAAERYIDMGSPMLRRLTHKVFPGPVTLVVDVAERTIETKLKHLGNFRDGRDRIYFQNTVGLRCPDHEVTQRVVALVPGPVLASSANRHGDRPPLAAGEAAHAVGDAAALIIDGGPCRYSRPSTIVRLRQQGVGYALDVQRIGVYSERYIRKMLHWTMLLVCSGNTCRSPMAEFIAKQIIAGNRKIKPKKLESAGIRVISAGAFALDSMPASPEALEAMNMMDIDLSAHRSRLLTLPMIHEADVIYCMTDAHRRSVVELDPFAADKTFVLDPSGDIEDPIGGDQTTYQRCAEILRRRLEQRLREQQI